jgi:hypothetical protein
MGFVYNSITAAANGTFGPIRPLTDTPDQNKAIQIGQNPGASVISLGVLGVVNGLSPSLTWTVNISCDPPNNLSNWFPLTALAGQTTSQYSPILYPVSAIQLVVTNYSAGSITLGVVQWP